ncbi:MAG: diacylglycerol kinase family protein [Armatimonadota bacterium]
MAVRALLVTNPNAGRVRGETSVANIRQLLAASGFEVEPVPAEDRDAIATRLAEMLRGSRPEETRVVAAGGDGTIHSVLPALQQTGIPLVILPVGSVNVLARELGIPLSLKAAVEVAASGQPRRVDLGLADGRPFALMAGLGFDAAVVHSVSHRVKGLIGSFAYVAKGLQLLARQPLSTFSLTADDSVTESTAWLAVVANASRYTYGWQLSPDARIDDGWLDLCLFEATSPARKLRQAAAALAGRHASCPGVRHIRARRLELAPDPPVALQLDGDAAGYSPVSIHVAPGALAVVVPSGHTPRD